MAYKCVQFSMRIAQNIYRGAVVGTVASSSGAAVLFLFCMIIMALSVMSMVIFACGDSSEDSSSLG